MQATSLVLKLTPFFVIAYFWFRAPEQMIQMVRAVRSGPAAMRTLMDMGGVRNLIASEIILNEHIPVDLEHFLHGKVFGNDTPHLDRWGSPYRLEEVPHDPVLRSCGPDLACGTVDDISMTVLPKKTRGQGGGDRELSADQ